MTDKWRERRERYERRHVERQIIEKMHEIIELYKRYNPDGNYLTMFWIDGCYHANNDAFLPDFSGKTIDVSYDTEKDDYIHVEE